MLTVPAFQRSVQGCLSPPLTVQVPSIPLLVLVFFCWATSSRQLRNLVPLPVPLWGCLSLLVGPLTSHGRLPPHMGSLLTFPGLPCPALGCLRGDALLSPSGSDFLCWAATRVIPSSPHSQRQAFPLWGRPPYSSQAFHPDVVACLALLHVRTLGLNCSRKGNGRGSRNFFKNINSH